MQDQDRLLTESDRRHGDRRMAAGMAGMQVEMAGCDTGAASQRGWPAWWRLVLAACGAGHGRWRAVVPVAACARAAQQVQIHDPARQPVQIHDPASQPVRW